MKHNKYTSSLTILLLLAPSILNAQQKYNIVKTETFLDEEGTRKIVSSQYYDGLGRPSITVENTADGTQPRIISAQCYDKMGRESRKILPTPGNGNAETPSVADVIESATSFYGDRRPYTEISYDAL